jgi:hypothetical protein
MSADDDCHVCGRSGVDHEDICKDYARLRLKWTKDKPTQPGWYWWRWSRDKGNAHITRLNEHWQAMENKHVPSNAYYLFEEGEWAGPIEPPA